MATFECGLTFEGFSEIISKVKSNVVQVATTLVRQEAEDILREIVANDYGTGMTAHGYVKTGEMSQAVSAKEVTTTSRSVSFVVTIDSEMLGLYKNEAGKLNTHMGINGEDFREGLPIALDQGSSGSPIYNHAGTHYMDKAYAIMLKKLIQTLANGLRSKGFEVVIG